MALRLALDHVPVSRSDGWQTHIAFLSEVNNSVKSKIEEIKERVEKGVALLAEDERLKNRRKLDPPDDDVDAIEKVIDKATRTTKEFSKKPAPAF